MAYILGSKKQVPVGSEGDPPSHGKDEILNGMVHNTLVQVENLTNEEAKRTHKETEGKQNHGEKDVTNIFCALRDVKSPTPRRGTQT